jgi:hypothetical protein
MLSVSGFKIEIPGNIFRSSKSFLCQSANILLRNGLHGLSLAICLMLIQACTVKQVGDGILIKKHWPPDLSILTGKPAKDKETESGIASGIDPAITGQNSSGNTRSGNSASDSSPTAPSTPPPDPVLMPAPEQTATSSPPAPPAKVPPPVRLVPPPLPKSVEEKSESSSIASLPPVDITDECNEGYIAFDQTFGLIFEPSQSLHTRQILSRLNKLSAAIWAGCSTSIPAPRLFMGRRGIVNYLAGNYESAIDILSTSFDFPMAHSINFAGDAARRRLLVILRSCLPNRDALNLQRIADTLFYQGRNLEAATAYQKLLAPGQTRCFPLRNYATDQLKRINRT